MWDGKSVEPSKYAVDEVDGWWEERARARRATLKRFGRDRASVHHHHHYGDLMQSFISRILANLFLSFLLGDCL